MRSTLSDGAAAGLAGNPFAVTGAWQTRSLSHPEVQFWSAHFTDRSGYAYNVTRAYELRGPLDAARLARALSAEIRQWDVFRTTYHWRRNGPYALVEPAGVWVPIHVFAATEHEVRAIVAREQCRPFVLAKGPLYRIKLARCSCERHILMLTLHHIIVDERSLALVLARVSERYRTGSESMRVEVAYADYVAARAGASDTQRVQSSRLRPTPAGSERPALSRPDAHDVEGDRTARPGGRPCLRAEFLPSELDLTKVAARIRSTPFAIWLGAVAAAMHALTGSSTTSLAVVLEGREDAVSHSIVGAFVYALAVVVEGAGLTTVGELPGRAAAGLFRALGDRPSFADGPRRLWGDGPDTMRLLCVHAKADATDLELDDLDVERQLLMPLTAKCDLMARLVTGRQTESCWIWNRSRVAGRFVCALADACSEAIRAIASTPEESYALLVNRIRGHQRASCAIPPLAAGSAASVRPHADFITGRQDAV